MRSNYFNEKIATPGDSYDDVAFAYEELCGEMPTISGAEIIDEKDQTYGYGGELLMTPEEETDINLRFKFDGFETAEAAQEWLINTMGVAETDIEIIL